MRKGFSHAAACVKRCLRLERAGAPEEAEVTLPYSHEPFSVPKNLNIYGSMNTADRSLALLDVALRRRFEFEAFLPDTRDVEGAPLHNLLVQHAGHTIDIRRMLAQINARIEALLDRDHCIGHAYFIGLRHAAEPFEQLASIFQSKIIPLLEEYFLDDRHKVRLILGDNQKPEKAAFYQEASKSDDPLEDLFGREHGLEMLTVKRAYRFHEAACSLPEAYVGIYQRTPG